MTGLNRLKRRPEFLRVAASGLKAAAPGLVLQARKRGDEAPIRVGYTASRRVGGAVERNRAKRRLRAVAADVLAVHGRPGCDYVLIARQGTLARPFAALSRDLAGALKRLDLYGGGENKEAAEAARVK
ncbi:MAG TPA: ribonuclease P protein component [Alphaproteobacteria bacterium]|nr:ribonuclease P protein component [Alphaproteobacteria bacterium]